MKSALILVNAYTRSQSELNQPRRIAEELQKLGVQAELRRNDFFPAHVRGGITVSLSDYDFCVYLDKDKYVPRMLEGAGMRLFNRAQAVETCDDKMLTHIALAGAGLDMPETFSAPLCYYHPKPVPREMLDAVEEALGYPVVVKECYGSLGKGVFLARDRGELEGLAEGLKCKPHLFQKFIGESAGRDVRVIAVGGKAVAAMRRSSLTDFRSNAELGGSCDALPVTEELDRICGVVSARLGLDYCGIDLLCGARGYVLCEVNSNAFFGGIERATGVNVAACYARHMVETVYGKQ